MHPKIFFEMFFFCCCCCVQKKIFSILVYSLIITLAWYLDDRVVFDKLLLPSVDSCSISLVKPRLCNTTIEIVLAYLSQLSVAFNCNKQMESDNILKIIVLRE
jgi:hypothetical protein